MKEFFFSLREKSARLPSVTKGMLNYISELPQHCVLVCMEWDELEMTLSNFVIVKKNKNKEHLKVLLMQ